MTAREALAEARRRLAAAGIDTAEWEASQLVAHALGTTPTEVAQLVADRFGART